MDLFNLVYILTTSILLLLVLVVFLNRRDTTGVSFVFLSGSMLAWVVTLWLYYLIDEPEPVLILGRLNFVAAALLAPGVYFFGRNFPEESFISNRTKYIITIPTVFLASITQFTGLVVEEEIIDGNNRIPVFGSLYPVFLVFFLIFVLAGATILIGKYIKSTQDKNSPNYKQLRILVRSLVAAIAFGVFTSLIVPIYFTYIGALDSPVYFTIQNLAPLATLLFSAGVTYAILRYRFLDVRVLIGRIIYHLLLAFFSTIFIIILAAVDSYLSIDLLSPLGIASIFVFSIIFVSLFNSLNSYIETQVSSRLINPGYDPLKSIESLTKTLGLVLDLEEISRKLIDTFSKTIRPSQSGIIILSKEEDGYQHMFGIDNETGPLINKISQIALLIWENTDLEPIVYNRLYVQVNGGKYKNIPNLISEITLLLQDTRTRVILPINEGRQVNGIALLGEKEADASYTQTDVEFLKSLARNANLAIERSLLYTEVQNFANTLQEKVNVATAELQEANQSLQTTLSQLQEIRRRERDMIDVMGHELRTPMSIVRNAMSLLEREYNKHDGQIPPDKLKKYLDMGVESAKREITLIETLLSATKVDASRIQLYLTKVDLKDVISDSFDGHTEQLSEKGLELKYVPPENDIFIFCDRTRIQQVMDNFLSNAIKYTPQGFIEIKAWEDATNGWVSIKDSGIGIDEEDLRNLGKKFFRAKQYIPKQEEGRGGIIRPGGTGLGLYVTFELIRVMGGTLYINSKVGEGTSFTWSMPRFSNQPDKQTDQTFDEPQDIAPRNHIILNGQVPQPN